MEKIVKVMTKTGIVIAVVLLITGCSHILVPIDGPLYRGEMLEQENLKVEVIPGQYYMEFDRDDLFLPVHVILKNNTNHRVQVGFKNFLMLDDRGNKYDAANMDEVLTYYRVMSLYVYPYYASYNWYYSYYRPTRWYHPYATPYYIDLIQETFLKPQKLDPGEEIAGFLYFKGAARFADEQVTLVAKFAENDMKPVEYVFMID